MKVLFDTNILIDYLNGVVDSKLEIDRHSDRAISVITWMEVMVGTNRLTVDATRGFLNEFRLVPIDEAVAECAVELRQAHRIKLPDAIVWASARVNDRLFVTRNIKDFPPTEPGVRVPYGI